MQCCVCVCVCACLWVRERGREGEGVLVTFMGLAAGEVGIVWIKTVPSRLYREDH
jgi:hypothetical protein